MFQALRADNSPFTEQQIEQLQSSLGNLDVNQSLWLSGFIAGRLAETSQGLIPPPTAELAALAPPASRILPVFYASQTGNGEEIARAMAREAERAGLRVTVQSLAALRPAALKKLDHAAFVISTHGEGDPPDDALDLFEYLKGPRAARLEQLKFRILALGDRSYSQFCAAGRELEKLLLARGAEAFDERVECDIDYEQAAAAWSTDVVRFGQETLAPEVAENRAARMQPGRLSVVPQTARWSRANPFMATVERVQKITGLESAKDVYHLELSLEGSGLDYQPGDSLGVWAPNRHELVSRVLTMMNIDADEKVLVDEHYHSMHELLTRRRELTRLSPDTIQAYAVLAQNSELQEHFNRLDEEERRDFIENRQFVDLLIEFPVKASARIKAEELAGLLRPLAPRSYSIASSRAMVDEEVHITVATLITRVNGEERRGVASDFLNHHMQAGDEVGVFLEPNRRFRLPEDADTPLIFIAAGTGVAPYRAFLQHIESGQGREAAGPDTWLIFGNPHLRTDFLYQREWLDWRSRGLLTRIDGAFSRDQEEKHYVQHVVREQGERLVQWLNRKARIYVCGGLAMGREVEAALRDVLAQQNGVGMEQAAEQVAELRRSGRLLKDLY